MPPIGTAKVTARKSSIGKVSAKARQCRRASVRRKSRPRAPVPLSRLPAIILRC